MKNVNSSQYQMTCSGQFMAIIRVDRNS